MKIVAAAPLSPCPPAPCTVTLLRLPFALPLLVFVSSFFLSLLLSFSSTHCHIINIWYSNFLIFSTPIFLRPAAKNYRITFVRALAGNAHWERGGEIFSEVRLCRPIIAISVHSSRWSLSHSLLHFVVHFFVAIFPFFLLREIGKLVRLIFNCGCWLRVADGKGSKANCRGI